MGKVIFCVANCMAEIYGKLHVMDAYWTGPSTHMSGMVDCSKYDGRSDSVEFREKCDVPVHL